METTLDRREERSRRVSMRVAVELGLDDYEERFEADAVNLGAGGLSIRSSCLPDVGTRLKCRFESTPGGTPIATNAEVVWTRLDAERGGEFGLRFVEMEEQDRGLIEEMLAERAAYSVTGLDAPVDDDATLELGAAGTAIQARVARRGRRSARFEQRLDLLSLGRSLLAREQGHRGRQGSISGISLRLEEGTPVLSVNVDFEGELSFGEFEWSAADLDAILEDGAEAAAPVASHDTIPDLETPGAMAEAEAAASTGHKMKRVTVTEFEAALPHLVAAPPDADTLLDPPSVAGTVDAMDLADRQSYPDELAGYGAADVDDGAGGPVLSITATGESSPGTLSEPGLLERPLEDQDWGDVQDARDVHPEDAPAPGAADADEHVAAAVATPAVSVKRPSAAALESIWVQRALSVVAIAARATERLRAEVLPIVLGWLAAAATATTAFARQQFSTATRMAKTRMPAKQRRRTTAGPSPRAAATKRTGLPRNAVLATLAAGVVALGVVALSPGEAAEVQPLHRSIDATEAPAAPAPDAPVLSAGAKAATPAVDPASVPKPASVPEASPYAVDVKDPASAPAAAAVEGPVFGDAAAEGRRFTLRMTAPVKSLRGVPDAGGFTVHVPGALSLDRAGPIAASHRAVRRSMILNKGDHAELTIRFSPDTTPAYRVRGNGTALEIIIGK